MASQDVQVPNDETPMTTSGSSQSRSEGCQLKGGVASRGYGASTGPRGGDSLAPLGRACRGTGLWARSPRRPAVTYGFFRGPWNPVLLRTPHTPPNTRLSSPQPDLRHPGYPDVVTVRLLCSAESHRSTETSVLLSWLGSESHLPVAPWPLSSPSHL